MTANRGELEALKEAMRALEPDADERRRLGGDVLEHALAYLEALPNLPSNNSWDGVFAQRLDPEFTDEGREAGDVLSYFGECVNRPGFTTTSPRFMAYIPGGGLFHSALGDFLAAVSNKYSGFASASPGAVRIENACCAWMAGVIGFPETSAGTLTSGGSIANLTAIIAAREARDPDGGGAIYMTRFAHHCVDKALHICGRGRAARRMVDTDDRGRIDVNALKQAIERDLADGVRPWLVVASAGTIDNGSIDPLPEIADLCERHGIWFHVDGAYGGLFALCDHGRTKLAGIERADSVALDPHKTLFLPYGTGAALVRDGKLLQQAFTAHAAYITPLGESEVGPSPADLSPELTRHFRALRLWLPLQIAGLSAFKAAQREKLALAQYFHARLSELDGFDAGPPPDLTVVAFRYRPDDPDADALNERLLQHLQQEGRVMLSGTRIDGHFYLRCAILSFRTHVDHVDEAIEALQRGVASIDG
jgi:glutamate/tyrosine decarboxylase-like PLP-dependent enzyme